VAERLDEVWWDHQFSHAPPKAFKRLAEEIDRRVADGEFQRGGVIVC
jgi:hypothetical protein